MRKRFHMGRGQGRSSLDVEQLLGAVILTLTSQSAICGPIDNRIGEESAVAGATDVRSHASLAEPKQATAPAIVGLKLQDDDKGRVLEAIGPGRRFNGGNGYILGLGLAASWKPQLSNTDASYSHFNDTVFAEESSASVSHGAHSADCIVNKPGPAVWTW